MLAKKRYKDIGRRGISILLCLLLLTGTAACGRVEEAAVTTDGDHPTNAAEENIPQATNDITDDIQEEKPGYSGRDVEEILSGMTLEDKIGQMMIASYRVWKEVPEKDAADINGTVENAEEEAEAVNVTELNDEIRSALKEYHFGGTVLYAENYKNAEQTLRLVSDIQQTNIDGGGIPMLVATDQEGGNVARIGFGTTGVGNMALTATGDADNARIMASIYGEELSLLGINTDFAPVMDINNNPNNPVIGVRSFSDSPEVVSEYGLSYMKGLHEKGTISTLKHFPGHGNTDTDSHTGFPCIQSSYEELKKSELIPFKQAIDAGADMIMTAHIQYPQIETETYTSISSGEQIYLPATMSHTILTDILRKDMGFEGVIVTDALDMAAISENFETEDILRLSINAGANMLILPIITDKELFQKTKDMTELAVKLAKEGKIDSERIDDSVRRILTLKKKYGLLDVSDYSVTDDRIQAAVDGVGDNEKRDTAWNMAEKALTLVKNEEGAFPIQAKSGDSILILFSDGCTNRTAAGELAVSMSKESKALPEDCSVSVMLNTAENEKECMQAAKEADHVILVYRMYNSASIDPAKEDGFSSAVFDHIIEDLHKDNKHAILISCQLPYDAARFQAADAILLTYNIGAIQELPAKSGEGSAYTPNLVAALCSCFGQDEPTGVLPVNIPELDENYLITDSILYERGVGD